MTAVSLLITKSIIILMKIILITISISVLFGHGLHSQSMNIAKSNGEVTHLIRLNGEDQHGREAGFVPPEENPLLIFFLPKTETRTEAEALMDEITARLPVKMKTDHKTIKTRI